MLGILLSRGICKTMATGQRKEQKIVYHPSQMDLSLGISDTRNRKTPTKKLQTKKKWTQKILVDVFLNSTAEIKHCQQKISWNKLLHKFWNRDEL